ncbi:MAG TPA: dynamin family protein [Usitatibacter sp.]|nr:dynamin family protein [Usitatibacter sp.]
MDLKQYEAVKFELAQALRSIGARIKEDRARRERLHELFVRLAEDRFNLAVVGRFSRGKSSLMNAIIGTNRLPTGVLPVTSVITAVAYGSHEEVVIRFQRDRVESRVPLAALPEYTSQRYNPGNVRRVREAEVRLPAEILRRGFHFVDTPGLASTIAENTRTTEEFLPEADAFVVVTSHESPLSEEEMDVIRAAVVSDRRTFVVVNKHDAVSAAERSESLLFIRRHLERLFGPDAPSVFSVSARDALEAKLHGDPQALEASGIGPLEEALARFLLEHKRDEFLLHLEERIAELAREVGGADTQVPALGSIAQTGAMLPTEAGAGLSEVGGCEICAAVFDAWFDLLRVFQQELADSPERQRAHAERGGLCGLHTWQYASLASTHGICTGYPALLERLSKGLHEAAGSPLALREIEQKIRALLPGSGRCEVCEACRAAERKAAQRIRERLAREPVQLESLGAICMPHLPLVIECLEDVASARRLLARQARILERISEDMRRYATKHDALRRDLGSEEEITAAERALSLVAGHRRVHSAAGK